MRQSQSPLQGLGHSGPSSELELELEGVVGGGHVAIGGGRIFKTFIHPKI